MSSASASPRNSSKQHNNSNNTGSNSHQGIFVFEADTKDFANRKRAARACASCQKRKKRCPHTFTRDLDSSLPLSSASSWNGGISAGNKGDAANIPGKSDAEKVLPNLTHKEPIRFVGDLNPESILTDLSTRTAGKATNRFSRINVWVEQSRLQEEQLRIQAAEEEEERERTGTHGAGNDVGGPIQDLGVSGRSIALLPSGTTVAAMKAAAAERYSKIERGRRTLTGHQKNYLQAVGAFRVLPKATQDALVTVYIEHIDPLLPIVDGEKFFKEYMNGEASVFLVQAVCLVACKREEVKDFLRLSEEGSPMEAIPFARTLHTGLDAAIKADLEADRFTKIQIMTLMSLHNDGPGGIEESSQHLVHAIHDAQTTGLHINTPGRTRNDQAAMLWWTLWTLDKFNACLGGRPLMIAERDIDILDPELLPTERSQALAAWMAIGKLLDGVIEYYRPIAEPDVTGWEKPWQTFQELTAHCDLEILEPSQRNTLEICYNIVGILACRAGGPTTASYNRRITCADRIQQLVSNGQHSNLAPIPLLPYAVSLSLTVAYRGLRDHHTDPAESLAGLATRCEILESLRQTWWTADAMAKLGRKALTSLQKPPQAPGQETYRRSTVDMDSALESEVAVCKYGPFNETKKDSSVDSADSGRLSLIRSNSHQTQPPPKPALPTRSYSSHSTDSIGNALQVLSDAAATHGLPNSSTSSMTRTDTPSANTVSQSKRRKLVPAQTSFYGITAPISNLTYPSTHSHSHLMTANIQSPVPSLSHSAHHTTANTNSIPQTPSSSTNLNLNGQASHQHHHNNTSNALIDPTLALAGLSHDDPFSQFPTTTADYDPNMLAFNEIDHLFEGFFDLSMPTMFHDPLFEGANFFVPPGLASGTGSTGYSTSDEFAAVAMGGGFGNPMGPGLDFTTTVGGSSMSAGVGMADMSNMGFVGQQQGRTG